MNCIICSKPADNTINCTRHDIEISLCDAHINECSTCDKCTINPVKV